MSSGSLWTAALAGTIGSLFSANAGKKLANQQKDAYSAYAGNLKAEATPYEQAGTNAAGLIQNSMDQSYSQMNAPSASIQASQGVNQNNILKQGQASEAKAQKASATSASAKRAIQNSTSMATENAMNQNNLAADTAQDKYHSNQQRIFGSMASQAVGMGRLGTSLGTQAAQASLNGSLTSANTEYSSNFWNQIAGLSGDLLGTSYAQGATKSKSNGLASQGLSGTM